MTVPAVLDAVAAAEGADVGFPVEPALLAGALASGLASLEEQPVRASEPASSRQPSAAARRRPPARLTGRFSACATGAPDCRPESTRRKPTRRQYREGHEHVSTFVALLATPLFWREYVMPTVLRRRNQACCAGLPVRPSRMMADVKGSSSTGTPCALGDRISVPRRTNSPCLERSAPSHGEVSQTASKIPVRKRADRGLPAHRDATTQVARSSARATTRWARTPLRAVARAPREHPATAPLQAVSQCGSWYAAPMHWRRRPPRDSLGLAAPRQPSRPDARAH